MNVLPTLGLEFWTHQTTDCGNDQQCIEIKRINISAAFYLSIEFKDTGYLVERIYKAAYGDRVGSSVLNNAHQLAVPIVALMNFWLTHGRLGVIVGQGWEQVLEQQAGLYVRVSVIHDCRSVCRQAEY